MRKVLVVVGCLMAMALVLGRGVGLGQAVAADATPAAGTGVQVQKLGTGQTAVAPGRTLILQQRTFAPGSDTGAHPAPGPVVLYVESGSVTFKVIDGAAMATKAGEEEQYPVAAGQSITLNAGDAVTYDQGVVHEVANPGTVPAVTLEARLNPTAPAPAATPAS